MKAVLSKPLLGQCRYRQSIGKGDSLFWLILRISETDFVLGIILVSIWRVLVRLVRLVELVRLVGLVRLVELVGLVRPVSAVTRLRTFANVCSAWPLP